jgi:cell division protein FtsL
MTDKELKNQITSIYKKLIEKSETPDKIIAKAVSLGMKYQEEKIKIGLKAVFDNLNI